VNLDAWRVDLSADHLRLGLKRWPENFASMHCRVNDRRYREFKSSAFPCSARINREIYAKWDVLADITAPQALKIRRVLQGYQRQK
jgi:hypothetical protein